MPVVLCLTGIWIYFELRRIRRMRITKIRLAVWPSFIEAFTSSLQAGVSITDSFQLIGEFDFPGLNFELKTLQNRLDRGELLESALSSFRNEVAISECDYFVKLLTICHKNGGSALIRSLSNHANLSRRKLAAYGDASARHGAILAVGRLGIAAPWILVSVLGVNDSARRAFDSPDGMLLLLMGILVSAAAYYLMKKAAALPDFDRTFANG
jgi:tight adherence protein B